MELIGSATVVAEMVPSNLQTMQLKQGAYILTQSDRLSFVLW
jgi:hypothetical protein